MDKLPKISNCKSCGNKIKMTAYDWDNHGATIKCPQIKCGYCDVSAGYFYPNQELKCVIAWNDKQDTVEDNK